VNQREADRAPVEMQIAPAAQRQQEHAADDGTRLV